jgi:putative phosphoribosyl transferase
MTFASREDAGRQLVGLLRDENVAVDLVLGLPRGGVVVAAEVARELQKPLDTLIVRKIGHPINREFAVGALAEPDVVVLDDASLRRFPAIQAELDEIIAEETQRLREYQANFHSLRRESLEGRAVLLVDDGIATGATAEAAIQSARQQKARNVTVAAPVASLGAMKRLRRVADAVIALKVDPFFNAVGQYYREFPQTTDEEVLALLRASKLTS